MRRCFEVGREIVRGNKDVESWSFPTFYVACKRRFQRMTPDEISSYQLARARQLVRYAVRHSPFFARHYADHNLDDVWSLPSVDKATMMAHLGEYNTLGFTRQEILDHCLYVEQTRDFSRRLHGINIGMSSGTSGNKSVEITTPREETYLRAAFFARFPFGPGFPIGKRAINLAFILRVSTPAFNIDLLGNHLTYISQLDDLASICIQLEQVQPNMLSAPPSMLKILAREKKQDRLKIVPRRLIAYAEVLYPETRQELESVFGCPVFEIYKATEGAIAVSCAHQSLHINEDIIAVELFNEDGTPTPPGQPSRHMRVTDLHKTSQPIIRYALNDMLTISPRRCACGSSFRVIERIDGRSDDLFWGVRQDTGEYQFIFPDYIRRAVITVSDDIQEYQVVQQMPDKVLVRLQLVGQVSGERIAHQVGEALIAVFVRYGCHEPSISVEFGSPQVNPNSQKLVRIQRAFEMEL